MSIPRKIGIHAPYTWDEATYMACRIGNFAKQLGIPVSYCSFGQHNTGVWPEWDEEVLRGSSRNFRQWATGCSHIIWFDAHGKKLEQARKWGIHNTLVPLVHRLSHPNFKYLTSFDTIACPTHLSWKVLVDAGTGENATCMGWDPGLHFERKMAMCSQATKRLLVVPEVPLTDEMGLMLAYTCRALCDGDPSIEVTILQTRQWPRIVNKAMLDLTNAHCCRIGMLRRPSYPVLVHACKAHDWLFYAAIQVSAGIRVSEALACGTPVIAFNVPPLSEVLVHGVNAELIDCEISRGFLDLPYVRPNAKQLLEALEQVMGDTTRWHMVNQESWSDNLEAAKERFESFWKFCWGCG